MVHWLSTQLYTIVHWLSTQVYRVHNCTLTEHTIGQLHKKRFVNSADDQSIPAYLKTVIAVVMSSHISWETHKW